MNGRRPNDVRTSPTLLLAAFLVPATGSAQIATSQAPPPDTTQQYPLTVLKEAAPPATGDWGSSIKGTGWWKPPDSASQIPRWKIGSSVAFNTPGGLVFSGGLFGRRGDAFPLYFSEGVNPSIANSLRGPGSYQLQWDTTVRVSKRLISGSRLKLDAFGELVVPLTPPHDPADPSTAFLTSRTIRFGLVAIF
jgi:hypothetical protein